MNNTMENINTIVVGMYQTNCFLIKNQGHVLIIDPGKKPERIADNIDENDVVDGILLTHGHFDHIGAVDDLSKQFNCPVYVHEADVELIRDSSKNTSSGMSATVSVPVELYREGEMQVGQFELTLYFAPGHTEGCTLIQYKNHLFTGDVLFEEGIGRTDLYGGNMSKMRQSLKLFQTFASETIVYPGHGPCTTIEHELQFNPYF